MNIDTEAVLCAVLPHGEHGAIVRALTSGHGLLSGYVRGGRGRRLRPVLQPGNGVAAVFRARVDEQLPSLTVELVRSRALLALDALSAAALEWLTGFVAATLPEGLPYPAVHAGLEALLDRMAGEPSLRWAAELVRFEVLLLAELGFGLDLAVCVATGEPAETADLTHVSPRSGGAVSRVAAAPYVEKLLPLPAFLLGGVTPSWPDIADGLRLTGFFLERDLIEGRARGLLPLRSRLLALVLRSRGPHDPEADRP